MYIYIYCIRQSRQRDLMIFSWLPSGGRSPSTSAPRGMALAAAVSWPFSWAKKIAKCGFKHLQSMKFDEKPGDLSDVSRFKSVQTMKFTDIHSFL